jgi:hypothetical protein
VKGGHGIELLSDPGKKLIIPEPSAGFPIGQSVIAIGATVAALVWTLFALEGRERDPRLDIAIDVVALTIGDMKAGVASEARLMADDARIRSTLATPDIDRGTIQDVLEDLREAGAFTGVAVFDVRGRAVASVGPKELADVDLSVTRLAAGEGKLWSLGDALLLVAQAPVQLGSQSWAILSVRKVERAFVDKVSGAVKASIAIGMEGRSLVSGFVDPADAAALQEALKNGDLGVETLGGRNVLVRELESSKRPVLIAAAAAPKKSSSARMWLPLLLIALSGAASIIVAYRR